MSFAQKIVVNPPVMNAAAFVDWALAQDGRWELIEGWPIQATIGEPRNHRNVKSAILRALEDRLPPGAPCSPEGDGALVRIDELNSLSPDAAVNCAPLDMNGVALTRPTVIFEVAVSSRERDLGEKRLSYFRNPDVTHYVVVTPEDRLVYHWRRGDAKPAIIEPSGVLELTPEPGLTIPTDLFFARLI